MDEMTPAQRAAVAALEHELLGSIPLTRAMELSVVHYTGDRLRLRAPLAPNVNDKGCAFGGSLSSLMTLACWGLARQVLLDADQVADIYVQDSTIEYLQPVWGDLTVDAAAAEGQSLTDFVSMFAVRGKSRMTLCATVPGVDAVAARLTARFVAKRREERTE